MNKHDYLALFKAMNSHLVEAQKCRIQMLDHIEKAKDALWVVADDIGIELAKEGE